MLIFSSIDYSFFDKIIDGNFGIIALIVFLLILPSLINALRDYFRLYRRRKKYHGVSLYDVDRMDGFEFEDFLEALFHRLGYKTVETPKSGDFGVDLILMNKREKICIQAKRYRNKVGISAVQEIYAGNSYYDGDRAIVITNSSCTHAARKLAEKIGVELIEREDLIKLMKLASKK